jgi:hypothetical protein
VNAVDDLWKSGKTARRELRKTAGRQSREASNDLISVVHVVRNSLLSFAAWGFVGVALAALSVGTDGGGNLTPTSGSNSRGVSQAGEHSITSSSVNPNPTSGNLVSGESKANLISLLRRHRWKSECTRACL